MFKHKTARVQGKNWLGRIFVIAVLFSANLVVFSSLPAQAEPSELGSGATLGSGGKLLSPDGHYQLIMQTDGNLVDYAWPRPLWASNTGGRSGAILKMQSDGNLVVIAPGNAPVWASNTAGNPGARLILQNDANLVVVSASGVPLWANGAVDFKLEPGQTLLPNWQIQSPDRRFRMVMQYDGNLVLYNQTGPTWATNTFVANSTLEMQSDGNLVVYSPGHSPVWASNTAGKYGSVLFGQNDGNFVLYAPGNVAVWATNSGGSAPSSYTQLAQQLVSMRATSKIVTNDSASSNVTSDTNDRSLARLQLDDLAAGKSAHLSMRCSYAWQYPSYYPGSVAKQDIRILQFLVELGNTQKTGVNSLFGQCHSSVTTYHHLGMAVDFDCRWTSAQLSKADSVAAKYAIRRNGETCAANAHWHFSVGGR